eukprot:2339875-Pleurochrysis_carterae.AAC.1
MLNSIHASCRGYVQRAEAFPQSIPECTWSARSSCREASESSTPRGADTCGCVGAPLLPERRRGRPRRADVTRRGPCRLGEVDRADVAARARVHARSTAGEFARRCERDG